MATLQRRTHVYIDSWVWYDILESKPNRSRFVNECIIKNVMFEGSKMNKKLMDLNNELKDARLEIRTLKMQVSRYKAAELRRKTKSNIEWDLDAEFSNKYKLDFWKKTAKLIAKNPTFASGRCAYYNNRFMANLKKNEFWDLFLKVKEKLGV